MSMRSQLVLASASPARRQLLRDAGFAPIVCPSDLDESQIQRTDPAALVQALAQLKAEHIAARIRQEPALILPAMAEVNRDKAANAADRTESVLVLGCDSVLSLEGQIYGKPESPEAAIARWQAMRGTIGELYTGHALIDLANHRTLVHCAVTQVHFADIDDATIAAYVATGEPLGCAGCFASVVGGA